MQSRRPSKWLFYLPLMVSLAFLPGAVGKDHGNSKKGGQMKFRGLDRNNDGKITRDEWRGNDRSFSVHDRNGDQVLSGEEAQTALEDEQYDDFLDIDRNRDGLISRNEWRWEPAEFNRLDDNQNGSLTRPEYMDTGADAQTAHFPDSTQGRPNTFPSSTSSIPEDRSAKFSRLDSNGNGRISRDEWDGDKQDFNALDDNNNDSLSREEFLETSPDVRKTIFKRHDKNGNGVISKSEWTGDKHSFGRLDVNNDDKLVRDEFLKRYHELEQNFNGMDRDHNGQVSRAEWTGDKKGFANLDNNSDNVISFVEFVGVN